MCFRSVGDPNRLAFKGTAVWAGRKIEPVERVPAGTTRPVLTVTDSCSRYLSREDTQLPSRSTGSARLHIGIIGSPVRSKPGVRVLTRGVETLREVREISSEADPDVIEEWKWAKPTNPGTPVWSQNGGICTGETYKDTVELTFFEGASLEDPFGLFDSSLDAKVRRAIDTEEGDVIDEEALENRRRVIAV